MKLRHFLIAGWRAALASRLLSLIAVLGLAVGLAAAILMLLVVRATLAQNAFVPAGDRTYLGVSMLSGPGMAPAANEATNGLATPFIARNVGAIEAWARLAAEEVELSKGATTRRETIYWADITIANVLPLPTLRGNLAETLARPDGLALTARGARRWFGNGDPLGRALMINGRPMIVGAILADLPPSATDLTHDMLASARSAVSMQRRMIASPGAFYIDSRTYFRLRPGSSAQDVEGQIRSLLDPLLPPMMKGAYTMRLARVDRLALDADLHPGARDRLVTGALIAALVLVIAIANYVNLALARALRRQREIGIRKAAGASRSQIAAQFLGEAMLTVLIAALLAMAASEWLLSPLNAFLDTTATIDYLEAPLLVAAILAASGVIGFLAGAYPALVVSRLPPVMILRPGAYAVEGANWLRSVLASLQFAVLIGLLIATMVVHQQRRFAMVEGTGAEISQVLTVKASCPAGFVGELERLPGVRGVSCSGGELLSGEIFAFINVGGRRVATNLIAVLPSLFRLYGIEPIAGSLAGLPPRGEERAQRVVINETAARHFGLRSPQAAVGKRIPVPTLTNGPHARATIVAVVPDFQFTSVEALVRPTIYIDAPQQSSGSGLVSIKLSSGQVPETLADIDRLWRQTGQNGPIDRRFVQARIEELYRDLARSTQLFAGFAALAIMLASAGMIGIAVATADRRIKEIGIRKAMGADTGQIVALLLRQLTRPAIAANLIAWPVTWLVMRRWLEGYAYHIEPPLWLFPVAGAAAVAVAVASTGIQILAAARRRPVSSLRYE